MAKSWTPDAGDHAPDVRTGGFWVTHPQMRPDEGGNSRNGSNAYLENVKGERVWLWVNDVSSDFVMTGSAAQSRKRREFYPHNFSQPSLAVNCQTPNSYEYNRLGEFIRDAQLKGLSHHGDVLKLRLAGGPTKKQNPYEVVRNVTKGYHRGIYVDGYIINAGRGAERWINAPEYQFQFVISHAHQFLGLEDQDGNSQRLRNILELVNDPKLKWHWEEGKPHKGGGGKQHDGNDDNSPPPPDPYENWSATDNDPFTPPNWQ